MTNLELSRDLVKLEKQYSEMIQVIQRTMQKMVTYDQLFTQMRDKIEKSEIEISRLTRMLQQLDQNTKGAQIKY